MAQVAQRPVAQEQKGIEIYQVLVTIPRYTPVSLKRKLYF